MKTIQYFKNKSSITIKIPIKFLTFVARNNPEDPVVVLNEQQFAEDVLQQLEFNLGCSESGTNGFQELLDEAIYEATINNSTQSADFMEIDYEAF